VKQPEPKSGAWNAVSIFAPMVSERSNMRFAVVSLLSMGIDLLLFHRLLATGANIELSQVTSFFAGAIVNFALNVRRTFS